MKNQYLYEKFSKPLTYWMKREQLSSYIASFEQYNEKEKKDFLIKSNGKKINPKYAIFICKENKLRRKEDKKLLKNISFAELALINLGRKKEGISIIKTLLTCLF